MMRLIVLILLFGLFYRIVRSMFRNWGSGSQIPKSPVEPEKEAFRNLEIEDADFEEIKRDNKSQRSSQ